MTNINLTAHIPEDYSGMRVDQALAKCFPDYSRSRLTQWLKAGHVRINGLPMAPKSKVVGNEAIVIQTDLNAELADLPEAIALQVIYEDEHLLIINKPAGLVVHPGAGNRQGTLLNALLHYLPQLQQVPRAGIIHRLDKDTTGIMVVAKTLISHTALVASLALREIKREYVALVGVEILAGKTIRHPIGRHRSQRVKMTVTDAGKPAITHFRCAKRFKGFTLLQVRLETGRTHQIRVHLSHEGYPIVGDSMYGWRYKVPAQSSLALQEAIRVFPRQALHAHRLGLNHPITQQPMQWEAPIPEDLSHLLHLIQSSQQPDASAII